MPCKWLEWRTGGASIVEPGIVSGWAVVDTYFQIFWTQNYNCQGDGSSNYDWCPIHERPVP